MTIKRWAVKANMTSVVFCDEDNSPNYVEHLLEGATLRFATTDEVIGRGYIRAFTHENENIILYIGDWEAVE